MDWERGPDRRGGTMKEMVGGCCVCSDERGWAENPLVYCDGQGCTVAVHQGRVSPGSRPCLCCALRADFERARARLSMAAAVLRASNHCRRCELCPSRDGALKRTDNGGWAHVVCALYIPEVRFGNVTTMEPIVLQLVPQDRYSKSCFICEQQHHDSKASIGACMQCNKSGCKQYFHVTCAQAAGLLCEEAGNYMDNVKYCGYCPYHYQKLKRDSNIKIIPAFKPIPASTCDSREDSPERKQPARARMKGGTNMCAERRGPSRPPPPSNGQLSSDGGASSDATEPRNGATSEGSSPSPSAGTPSTPLPLPGKFTTANFTEATVVQTGSPVFGERQRKRGRPLGSTKEAKAQQAAQQAAAAAAAAAAAQSSSSSQQPQQQAQQQQQPVPLLQAKAEPLSPQCVGRRRVGACVVPHTPWGWFWCGRASPTASGEAAKNGSASGSKRSSSSTTGSTGPRSRKKAPPMLSPSGQAAAAASAAATNGLPPAETSARREVVGSGYVDHTYSRELSMGGDEGSRPASADSGLTQPARMESGEWLPLTEGQPAIIQWKPLQVLQEFLRTLGADDATLESPSIQAKMQPEDQEDKSGGGRASATLAPEGWPSCQLGPPRPSSLPQSPSWPESAAVPGSSLEELLERQWDQGAGFLMRQAQNFDIASLLTCLHNLRSENLELESRISGLQARRDQLLAVSTRLMGPLGSLPTHAAGSLALPLVVTSAASPLVPPHHHPPPPGGLFGARQTASGLQAASLVGW
ncbi:hypothetical protein HPB48_007666 [Haemaphysalis longicornis]|uniref:PHD-type domain-containing protein n=1 Tax=Haemaphysalis longicornis TaxID=44386 RepID=A0A9J6G3N7_HAELO|nr:hypothetical protein HPB48_007666 [Haemaphysalis longicornis]